MKVICKKNTAKELDLQEVKTLLRNEYDYGLILEKEYIVMGIESYKDSNCLYYLVDEGGLPNWCPYALFAISNNALPVDWYINIYDKKSEGNVFYLSGFYELCNNDDYHDLLIERDEKALEIYFKRKAVAEEHYNDYLYFKKNIIL